MAIAIVQSNSGTTGAATSASTFATTFAGASTSGNIILLICGSDGTISTPGGWALDRAQVTNAGHYVFRKTSAGETNFNITVTAHGCWALLELSGMAATTPLDGVNSQGTGTTQTSYATGTTATLAETGEFCLASWTTSQALNLTITTSGYTNSYVELVDVQTTNATATRVGLSVATKTSAATTAETSTATFSGSSANTGLVVTYKAAAAAAQLPAQPIRRPYTAAVDRAATW